MACVHGNIFTPGNEAVGMSLVRSRTVDLYRVNLLGGLRTDEVE
jgi:hypothetical protein